MDSRSGVWQLKRLLVSYCTHSGSSRGAREFIERQLPALREAFPHLQVDVQTRSGKHPYLEGKYINGREKAIGVKNLETDRIKEYAEFLVQQWGGKHVISQHGHRVRTTQQSVQGAWTPYTNIAGNPK